MVIGKYALVSLALMFALGSGVHAEEPRMNQSPNCPAEPYALWYPLTDEGMLKTGKMKITENTLSFDRQGDFQLSKLAYEHRSYFQLEHKGQINKKIPRDYLYFHYHFRDVLQTLRSCVLLFVTCDSKEDIEFVIQVENGLEFTPRDDVQCTNMGFLRYSDIPKIEKYSTMALPPDIYD